MLDTLMSMQLTSIRTKAHDAASSITPNTVLAECQTLVLLLYLEAESLRGVFHRSVILQR
jgi:hypothetical protein